VRVIGSRKRLVIATLALMAIGYFVIPTYLGLSEWETDLVATLLLSMAVGIYAYEDHRCTRSPAQLLRVLLPACLMLAAVAALMLLNGVRFAALIPLNSLCGGVLYWVIERYLPPSNTISARAKP
jgi:hypothetical protein